jgi:hypothetical protein
MGRTRRKPTESRFTFRFRGLRAATFILAGCLLWLLVNIGSLRRFLEAYHVRNRERDRVEEINRQVAQLRREKMSLELGMFENEKSVRETYRLVHPGERLILLAGDEDKTSRPAERETDRP